MAIFKKAERLHVFEGVLKRYFCIFRYIFLHCAILILLRKGSACLLFSTSLNTFRFIFFICYLHVHTPHSAFADCFTPPCPLSSCDYPVWTLDGDAVTAVFISVQILFCEITFLAFPPFNYFFFKYFWAFIFERRLFTYIQPCRWHKTGRGPSVSPQHSLIKKGYICVIVSHQGNLGEDILNAPPMPLSASILPSTVIALLSFMTASVDVTVQSVDCHFMSAAPKQRFVSVCPYLTFYMHTCRRFAPQTAFGGIMVIK